MKAFYVTFEACVVYPGAEPEIKKKLVIAEDAKDVWDAYDSSKNGMIGLAMKVISVDLIDEVDNILTHEKMDAIRERMNTLGKRI